MSTTGVQHVEFDATFEFCCDPLNIRHPPSLARVAAMGTTSNEHTDETYVRIACIQMEPEVGSKERNLSNLDKWIGKAADLGSKIIVAPELCNSGYMFNDRDEAQQLSEPIPEGPTCNRWSELASTRGLYLVAGICERDGSKLYNSAVAFGPDGYLGHYRKVHLWDREPRFFEPGDFGFPVFETPYGRIGALICYDNWFPEAYRSCALKGADLICLPTNWVPIPGQDPDREAMANILVMGAAHANSVFIAAADRVGAEREQPFVGQSLIVSYTGWPVAGPCSYDHEELIYADVDLSQAKANRIWTESNEVLRDRRPQTYVG